MGPLGCPVVGGRRAPTGQSRSHQQVTVSLKTHMIEIGTMGFPYRASAIATGAAMLAEAEGVDALWYPDHLMAWHPRALWQEAGGVLAEVVGDPHAYADPF